MAWFWIQYNSKLQWFNWAYKNFATYILNLHALVYLPMCPVETIESLTISPNSNFQINL